MGYFEQHLLPEEQNSIPYLPTTVLLLDFITKQYGQQIALSDENQEIRYDYLEQRIACRRHKLQELDLKARTNIGLFDGNSIDAVEWFLAVTTSGMVAVMIPPTMTEEALEKTAIHYELGAIIVGSPLEDRAKAVSIPMIAMSAMDQEGALPASVQKRERAAIFFTGGTTGTPKGVVLNHGAIMRGALNGTYRNGTVFGQTMVAALPFTHVFGMIFSMLSGLYAGAHMVVCSQMKDLFKTMAQASPTTMIAVPGMADLMLTVAKKRGINALGGKLKLIICGAAPVPPRLYDGFQPFGVQVLAGYGLTETANLVSGNLDMETHCDSVGKQYPNQEARIVDGELQVRGDMLFDGYWKDEPTTISAFDDGWFKTGDLARMNDEGFIYIVGRIKNLILLGNGENISPEEVEEAFYRGKYVQDCLVSETVISGNPVTQLEVYPVEKVSDEAVMEEMKAVRATLPSTMRPARMLIRHQPFEKNASMKIIRAKRG